MTATPLTPAGRAPHRNEISRPAATTSSYSIHRQPRRDTADRPATPLEGHHSHLPSIRLGASTTGADNQADGRDPEEGVAGDSDPGRAPEVADAKQDESDSPGHPVGPGYRPHGPIREQGRRGPEEQCCRERNSQVGERRRQQRPILMSQQEDYDRSSCQEAKEGLRPCRNGHGMPDGPAVPVLSRRHRCPARERPQSSTTQRR